MSTLDLSERLTAYALEQVEALVEEHLPGYDIPSTFAGHPVGPDVRADLAFTIGLLGDAGVTEIAGTTTLDAVAEVLRNIDGEATHTFFSYRVAETLRRWGPFDGNRLLASLDENERDNLAVACDSSSWIELLDGDVLPANYAAVLARCELAREDLGLPTAGHLDDLVERVRALMTRNPRGYLDDSEDGTGGRYDIYSADIYLFTEPLEDRLSEAWAHGARSALELVARTATRDGTAIPWGRSTGALGACLTIELAALALSRSLTGDRQRWMNLAANALDRMDVWFRHGLVTAHQHRSPYAYRGPERRLQMSLDCLGKLAYAAAALRDVADQHELLDPDELFPDRDELIILDEHRHAAVWAFRSPHLAFDLPLVGPTRSDYLPAPRNPGLFEVPVDSALVTGAPTARKGDTSYAAAGLPASLEHHEARLVVSYTGFPEVDRARSRSRRLEGRREVEFTVDRRTLRVRERLQFDQPPSSVSFQLTEAEGRPLRVAWTTPNAHRTDVIDVDGLAEYRSFWGELPRVHQIDIDPSSDVELQWEVTPLLRVATNAATHHYHRSLYDPLTDQVRETSMPAPLLGDRRRALQKLRHVDQFHLHWPEWFVPPDPDAARAFCDVLDDAEVRLVWTQHNLEPHTKDQRHRDVYQVFAERADLVIHHSKWGWDRIEEEYSFGSDTRHVLVPHGHFGHLMAETIDRAEIEDELGLSPCAIRVGIIGAPRVDKRTQAFMETFARLRRKDLQLLVLSLGDDDEVPNDPRIVGLPYEFVDRSEYNRRLAAIDVVALPFDPDGTMLTTGVVGDIVGLGLPVLASHWEYLTEVLGDAAILFHDDTLLDVLESLDREQLDRAAAECRDLQPIYDWSVLARHTFEALEDLGTRKI